MLNRMKQIGLRAVRDRALLRAGALRAGSFVRSLERAEPGIYTLCYHHVASTAQAQFSAQLGLLRRFGPFIDADTAVLRLLSGRAREERAFLLTFDDGYADNVQVALPVIRAHGVPAILFLVSDWLVTPPPASQPGAYMTRADVETWLAAGLSIGSHSASHRRFSGLDRDEAAREFARSSEALSVLTGRPTRHFACPWGVVDLDYDSSRDPALAHEAGYRTFFTTRRGKAKNHRDLLSMPRHVLEPEWDLYQLRTLLGGSRFASI